MVLLLAAACAHVAGGSMPPMPAATAPPDRPHAVSVPAGPDDAAWAGVWQGDDSSAVLRFTPAGDRLWIDAWDAADGEWFAVRDSARDGEAVTFTTTMPSTGWTLRDRIEREGESLRWSYEGNASGTGLVARVSLEPTLP